MRPLRHTYIQKPMNMPSGIVIGDRERAPRAVRQRVDDDDAEAGERDDDDEEDRDRGDEPGERADLALDDLGQRPAAAAGRRPQDHRVVHRAGETDAGDEPDEAGRVAELRRQHRADQRSGAGDGREVMAEHHPPAGGVVVGAVVLGVRGSRARIVQHPDAGRDEGAVVAVRDRQDAERRHHQIQSGHMGRR